jgi:hypothetical protein
VGPVKVGKKGVKMILPLHWPKRATVAALTWVARVTPTGHLPQGKGLKAAVRAKRQRKVLEAARPATVCIHNATALRYVS